MTRATTLILLLFASGGAAQDNASAISPQSSSAVGPLADRVVFVQIPLRDQDGAGGADSLLDAGAELPVKSRIVAIDLSSPRDGVTNLTPGFAAAGYPDLSYDGKRILFVGKRAMTDAFQVWEMNTDGSGLRQITGKRQNVETSKNQNVETPKSQNVETLRECPGKDGLRVAGRPVIYLSTIYTIDADSPAYQIAFSTDQDGGTLYTCRLDGTRVRRITFDPNGVSDPFLLSDGRLLYSSWLPATGVGPVAGGGTALLTINTDGTDAFAFAAGDEAAAIRGMPCETADGWVVYVESPLDSPDRGGLLVAVARGRSLHTRRVIADDPGGSYHSPSPVGDGALLVSYRPRAGESYGMYLLDMQTGKRTAEVFDEPQWHEVNAVLVRPRPRPEGRSSVVDEQADTGWLYCLDAYLSDREEAKRIEKGQIQRLRVIRAVENEDDPPGRSSGERMRSADRPPVKEEVLAEVDMEPDGSFLLEVPVRMPLRLETLDARGEVLQSMRHWIWVMPREGRGCIGCHEDRELTPPNRRYRALWKVGQRVGASGGRIVAPAAPKTRNRGDSQ